MSGAVEMHRFLVAKSSLCGLLLGREGTIDLREGEVSRNAIGACVQTEGYNMGRLNNDVVYADNGINLDSTDLPVPEGGSVLEEELQ